MARLPVPGSDDGAWGDILNDFLTQAHSGDGTLKSDSITDGHISASAGITATKISGTALTASGNLSGLSSTATSRTNLGLSVVAATDGLFVDVRDHGAATTNTAAANTTAFQAAINLAAASPKKIVSIPGGVFQLNELTLPNRVNILGTGRNATLLNYAGTGTFITNQTPDVRIFDLSISGFSDVAWYVHSSVSGGAVYNRWYNVTVLSVPTGYRLRASSSNANLWHGCRTGNCSAYGFDIQDCNDNEILGSQIETCGVGVYIDGSVSGANSWNRIRDCRIENCTTGIVVASANVHNTVVSGLWYDGSTPTLFTDNGTTTRKADLYMSVNGAGNVFGLTSGVSMVSGASVFLGSTSSAVAAASTAPLFLRGSATNGASAVGTWIGNANTLTTAGAKIVGFSRDTAVTHAQPVSYVNMDGSYEFVSGVKVMSGAGSPESVVTAVTGSMYLRSDGGAGTTFYVKESGVGNTGWIAK